MATKELGFRYHWVDRYCTPQRNSEEKRRLIQNMGTIYRASAVTPIAAAGSGPDYGLPGIGPGLRDTPAATRIGPLVLTPQFGDIAIDVEEPK
jgi:hypothetical protein